MANEPSLNEQRSEMDHKLEDLRSLRVQPGQLDFTQREAELRAELERLNERLDRQHR